MNLEKEIKDQKKIIKNLVNKKVDWKKESELISSIRINQNRLYKLEIQLLEENLYNVKTNFEFNKIQNKIKDLQSKLLK